MFPHKSSPKRPKYKQMVTTFHDIKQSLRRTPLQTVTRCLLGCCLLCIFYGLYLLHCHHLIPPWSSSPDIAVHNISNTNLSADSTLNDDVGIGHLNLSQLNMVRFVNEWGKRPTTRSPTASPTPPQSIWSRNISESPPSLISEETLKDIVIPNVVWDFGSCGCTGWGIGVSVH